MALDPDALEMNRAGKISPGQRSMLRARATGALLGFLGSAVFAVIAWWFALSGAHASWAAATAIATVAAPLALWAFGRIRADLRSGRVIKVTGIAVVTGEADDESPFRVRLQGRRFRVPAAVEGVLREPDEVTAFFTPLSGMLANLAPAENSIRMQEV